MPTTQPTTKRLCPLGLVLRGMRAVAGVTQASHAGALGMDATSLSRLERGLTKATNDRVVELLAALRLCRHVETQARFAILHGDGILTEDDIVMLLAHHGCRTVICLYKSHSTYGDPLGNCSTCGQQMLCRPEGHRCPNACGEGVACAEEAQP